MFDAYLVDWSVLEGLWRTKRTITPVIDGLGSGNIGEPYVDKRWIEDGGAIVAGLEVIESIQSSVGAALWSRIAGFVHPLWGEVEPIHELCSEQESGCLLAMSISPRTAARMTLSLTADERKQITGAVARATFDRDWFFSSEMDFMAYLESWLHLFARASQGQHGIVIVL